MIVGGYTVHLYCDFCKASSKPYAEGIMDEFAGRNERDCFRDARKAGWRIYREQRKAKCPRCVKKRVTE